MSDSNSHNTVASLEEIIRLKTQMENVDAELSQVKSSLDDRIKEVKDELKTDIREVKNDLHNRITRLETRLQWSVGIAVAVLAIVVPLLVKFVSS